MKSGKPALPDETAEWVWLAVGEWAWLEAEEWLAASSRLSWKERCEETEAEAEEGEWEWSKLLPLLERSSSAFC